jgi:hypothetical protein
VDQISVYGDKFLTCGQNWKVNTFHAPFMHKRITAYPVQRNNGDKRSIASHLGHQNVHQLWIILGIMVGTTCIYGFQQALPKQQPFFTKYIMLENKDERQTIP